MSCEKQRGTAHSSRETTHRVVPSNVAMDHFDLETANQAREFKTTRHIRCISQRELVNFNGVISEKQAERTTSAGSEVEFVASLRECAAEVCDMVFASAECVGRANLQNSQSLRSSH
jgi:hypothetical protein